MAYTVNLKCGGCGHVTSFSSDTKDRACPHCAPMKPSARTRRGQRT